MKKLIALILAITMMAGLCPSVMADWGSDENTYSVTGSTSLSGISNAEISNIELAVASISGTVVNSGDTFSFNDIVGPRTSEYGYKSALNGRGVKSAGGGVAQVASTLYLALKQLKDIKYTQKMTYGANYSRNYVSSSSDAILVDYRNKHDFAFVNNGGRMVIDMWTTSSAVYCTITVTTKVTPSDYGTQIGYASLPLSGTTALRNNVTLACKKIDLSQLYYSSEFSFNKLAGPRTKANGYGDAINGRGVRVTGGGVAEVATAVYMAIKNLSNIKILEKHVYGKSFTQDYVSSGNDAIVTDYNNGQDFRFQYKGYGTLTIRTYVNTAGNRVICEVYEKTGW